MSTMTMKELSKAMGEIDFAMLTTRTDGGQLATRPMSNNGEVEYDGDSFYFSWDSAAPSTYRSRSSVALRSRAARGSWQVRRFLAVEGTARVVRDKARSADHWSSDLERWFAKGIDTEGMVMIHVHADRIHYWDSNDEGEISI